MWHDITVPLSTATPEWPGDHPFHCGWLQRCEQGDGVNVATITTSLHVGTHADAPLHVRSDWPASESLQLSAFMGEATVIELPSTHNPSDTIGIDLLMALLKESAPERVLLKTRCSVAGKVFPEHWPALTSEAAQWLAKLNVVLFGIDAPSVDMRDSLTLDVHHVLLGNGMAVLESLDLRRIKPGKYELMAPPLAITGADAAPVRAIVRAIQD